MMEDYYTIQTPDHHTSLFADLHTLQKQGVLCDVILAAEDGEVMAHKVVLMAASKYFREKLSPNISTTASRICLKGISVVELANLVKYVYTGKLLVAKETMDVTLEISEILELNGVVRGYKEIIAYEEMKTGIEVPAAHSGGMSTEYDHGIGAGTYPPTQAAISGHDVHLSQTQVSANSSLVKGIGEEAVTSHVEGVTSTTLSNSHGQQSQSESAEDIQVTQYCEDGSTITYTIEQAEGTEANTSQTSTHSNEYKFEFNPYEEQYMDVSVGAGQQNPGSANLPRLQRMVNTSAEEQRAVDEQAQHQDLLAVAIETLSDASHLNVNPQRLPEIDRAVSSITSHNVEDTQPSTLHSQTIVETEKPPPYVNGLVESKTVTLSAGTITNDMGGKTAVYTVALDPSTIKQPLRMPKPHRKRSDKEKQADEKAKVYRKKKTEILNAALTGGKTVDELSPMLTSTPKQTDQSDAGAAVNENTHLTRSNTKVLNMTSSPMKLIASPSKTDVILSPKKSLISTVSAKRDTESAKKRTTPKILLKTRASKRNKPLKLNDAIVSAELSLECDEDEQDILDEVVELEKQDEPLDEGNPSKVDKGEGKIVQKELTEEVKNSSELTEKSKVDNKKTTTTDMTEKNEDFGQVVNFDSDDEDVDDEDVSMFLNDTIAYLEEPAKSVAQHSAIITTEAVIETKSLEKVNEIIQNDEPQPQELESKAEDTPVIKRTRASSKKNTGEKCKVVESKLNQDANSEVEPESMKLPDIPKKSTGKEILSPIRTGKEDTDLAYKTPDRESRDKKDEVESASIHNIDSPAIDKIRSSATKRKGTVPRRLPLPTDGKTPNSDSGKNIPIVRSRRNSRNEGSKNGSNGNGKSVKSQNVAENETNNVVKTVANVPMVRIRRNSKNEVGINGENNKTLKTQKVVDSTEPKESGVSEMETDTNMTELETIVQEKDKEKDTAAEEVETVAPKPVEVAVITVKNVNEAEDEVDKDNTKSIKLVVEKKMLPHVRLEKRSEEGMLALARSIAATSPKKKDVGEIEIEIETYVAFEPDVSPAKEKETMPEAIQNTESPKENADLTLDLAAEVEIKRKSIKRKVLAIEGDDVEKTESNKKKKLKVKKSENIFDIMLNVRGKLESPQKVRTKLIEKKKTENETETESKKCKLDLTPKAVADKSSKLLSDKTSKPVATIRRKSRSRSLRATDESNETATAVKEPSGNGKEGSEKGKPEEERLFICPEEECLFTSKTAGSVRRHRMMFHGTKDSPHRPIRMIPASTFMVKREQRGDSPKEPLTCYCCNIAFETLPLLQVHVKEKLLEEAECQVCGETFKLGYTFVKHQMQDHGMSVPKHLKRFDCPKCSFVGFSFKEIDSHFSTHEGNFVPCLKCDKSFKTYREMKTHLVTHKEKRFKCDQCDFSASVRSCVNTHTKVKHNKENKLYGCQFCLYKTPLLGNLRKHMYSGHQLIVVTKQSKENKEKFAEHPEGTILLLDGTVFDPQTMPLPKVSMRKFMNKTVTEIKKEEMEQRKAERMLEKRKIRQENKMKRNRRISLNRLPPEEFAKELLKRHEEYLKKPEKTQKFMSKSLAVATAHPSFPQASPSVRGTKANKLYNSPKIHVRHQYQELTPREAEHYLTVNTSTGAGGEPIEVVMENVEEEYAQDGIVVSIPETHQEDAMSDQLIIISSDGKESVVRTKDFYQALIDKGQSAETNQTMGVISALLQAGEQIQIQEREEEVEIQNQ